MLANNGNVFTGRIMRNVRDCLRNAKAVSYNSTKTMMAVGYPLGEVKVWELLDETEMFSARNAPTSSLHILKFNPSGSLLATGGGDGKVRVINTATGSQTAMSSFRGGIYDAEWIDDESFVCSGLDNDIRMSNIRTPRPTLDLEKFPGPIFPLAFNLGSGILASGYSDAVRTWSLREGVLQHTLIGHGNGVTKLKWSPDYSILASAGADHTVRLWDIRMGTSVCVRTLDAPFNAEVLEFSPSGRYLVYSTDTPSIVVFNILTGIDRKVFRLADPDVRIIHLDWAENGTLNAITNAGYELSIDLRNYLG